MMLKFWHRGFKVKKIVFILTMLLVLIILVACSGQSDTTPRISERDQNLATLARVWGFTKYTHQTFLTGELCWDEELLNLIPIIYSADTDGVNDILYNWFVGLGDDGFGEHNFVFVEAQVRTALVPGGRIAFERMLDVADGIQLVSMSHSDGITTFRVQVKGDDIPHLKEMFEFYSFEIIDINEMNLRQMANLSWINEAYLGLPLFERLSRFQVIEPLDRINSPVYFDYLGNSIFWNQQSHVNMDYSDIGYRLLGLFRVWNAMEYFFPYRDILDKDWHELLEEYIGMMLEGEDRLSYETTLTSLSRHLHDAHIMLRNVTELFHGNLFELSVILNSADFGFLGYGLFDSAVGYFPLPARLVEAEGRLVVSQPIFNDDLLPGDAILEINGRYIDYIVADMLQFMSYPNDKKALAYLSRFGLWSQTRDMTIKVLRESNELILNVSFYGWETVSEITPSYQRLENNIGLINPRYMLPWRVFDSNEIFDIMGYFADTDGLIIDLRQPPSDELAYSLADFLVEESQLFSIMSNPLALIPGVFVDFYRAYSGGAQNFDSYFYENPVVILMDEWTISSSEYTVMSLRNGANVTVMGNNSMGANGNVTVLPLPGGITMSFTGLGVYTPEGGQTQRIGLSPDILVDRTIQGIVESRDELMEAAVEFLLWEIENHR